MPKSQHILLVEDNHDDEELMIYAFKESKIANRIDVVRDGPEALDYLLVRGKYAGLPNHTLPAVVLLDINLPKIDGLEVLRQVRSNRESRHLPVVMLTSSRQQEDMLQSYDLGANSFVRKPVEFDAFVDAVRNLQVYWLILNEVPEPESSENKH